VKGPVTAVAILVLSLAAWTFFYLAGLPLGAAETTIVVGFVALLVTLASLAARRLRKVPASEKK
jgi:hypothetical protein